MYALYLLGVLIRRRGGSPAICRVLPALLAIVGLAVVLFTYDLNHGPFRMRSRRW